MSNTVKIEKGLTAYFKQPTGSSRPGVDWVVQITGDQAGTVVVRTYFPTSPPRETEKPALADKAARFITKKLAAGWLPGKENFLEADEDAEAPRATPRPWWKIFF
jgi:hypothetical protein